MKIEHAQTDVLCIGGGMGGLMAAIRARELGADVLVAEKGHAKRSGKGGSGCDHYLVYIPEIHGNDIEAYIDQMMTTQQGLNFMNMSRERLRTHISKTYDIVKLWESWGLEMKTNGEYYFAGHAYPGGFRCLLKYAGRYQKNILYKKTKEAGAKVRNRLMIFDLIVNNNKQIAGAVGLDLNTGNIVEIQAKAVILGTGGISRLYLGVTPAWIGNSADRISLTGDGRAMALRAGADLHDLELVRLHTGVRYASRYGQATWVGVYRDGKGDIIGPFVQKPEPLYGDATPEIDKQIFKKFMNAGRGPCYMDGTGISETDYKEMYGWLQHEGNQPVLAHMDEEGIDFRKNPIEVASYNQGSGGRITTNENGETSIAGLYAIGDEVGNGVSNATVYGWICGEQAVRIAKNNSNGEVHMGDLSAERIEQIKSINSRDATYGPLWKECNSALMQIMSDYSGELRSQAMLEAGLFHLRRLRKNVHNKLSAPNIHELGRSVELLGLMDMGEAVFLSALDRKETRGTHIRVDYPITNPLFNKKIHVTKMVDGKIIFEWRNAATKGRN